MKFSIIILFFSFCIAANAQNRFDSLAVDRVLLNLPVGTNDNRPDPDVELAIRAIDRNYRIIADTLYYYRSLPHTLFQPVLISIKQLVTPAAAFSRVVSDTARYRQAKFNLGYFKNDTLAFLKFHLNDEESWFEDKAAFGQDFISPSQWKDALQTGNILFGYKSLNDQIDSLSRRLNKEEREKLYNYLEKNYDHFSLAEKEFKAKAVRVRYIITGGKWLYAGIDIYGEHFLWTIDKKSGNVIKVERKWVY